MPHRIRTATAADLPSAIPLLNAAYGPNPAFAERLSAYLSLEPEGWVVVEGPSALIGIGGFVSFGRCAYIGLMGVSPDAQRRGIGAAIFEEVVGRCEARACSLLLLDASESGAPLYERYSFHDHGAALGYAIDPRAAGRAVDGNATLQVRPIEPGDTSTEGEAARFDARCYGADRTALVVRALRQHQGRAFVARDATGELVGYCIGQTRSLGPCMARSTEVASALVRRTLALPYESVVTWLIADQNGDAVALARDLGAVPTRRLRHMRRGDPASLASDWSTLYAKLSFAVG